MNTLAILGLTIAAALGVCAGARAAGPSPLPTHEIFSESSSPQHVTVEWGRYTVRVVGGWFEGSVTLGSRDHGVLCKVQGEILAVATARLEPSGVPDLIVQTSNGSNVYGCHSIYVFTQNGGLREMASITGGGGSFERLGRRVLYVMDYTGLLELAGDYCHACSPEMPLVFDWNGGDPVNQTRRYSWLTRYRARKYRDSLLADIPNIDSLNDMDPIYSGAAGYYGNQYELGQGNKAYRWIMRRLPSKTLRAEFQLDAYNIRRRIGRIPDMVSRSGATVVESPQNSVFFVNVLSLPKGVSP